MSQVASPFCWGNPVGCGLCGSGCSPGGGSGVQLRFLTTAMVVMRSAIEIIQISVSVKIRKIAQLPSK